MFKDSLYKLCFYLTAAIVAIIVLCHFTGGSGIIVVAAIGAYCALKGMAGASLFVFILLPFLTMLNPLIIHKAPIFAMVSRLTTLIMVISLVLAGTKRKGRQRLPLGYLFLYLVIALISSFQGYFPLVSYFKILNFSAFITGLYIGTRNINHNKDDLFFVRAGFLAIAAVTIVGSLAVLPFPSIAYYTSLRHTIATEGTEMADIIYQDMDASGLFTGITNHSQFLGPCLACLGGWLACDMLFVEHRIRFFHMLLLVPIPVMIAMTKSRIGLLAFCMLIALLMFYCLPHIQITQKERHKIHGLLLGFVIILILILIVAEVKKGTVSRLVRKTNDTSEDTRTLFEALTNSRQEKINLCLHDFHSNPLWGTGFQVTSDLPYQYQRGEISLFSAPIEKGLLPLMVLGETGIIGAGAFLIFLIMFYHEASIKGYTATLTLFSVLLTTNLAEATFFSPSGGGGVFWMFTVCGGFLIDMSIRAANQELPIDTAKGTAPLNPYRRSRISLGSILKVKK